MTTSLIDRSATHAFSVQQPWADMILYDFKDIENRTWKCPPRWLNRTVWLHAGKKHDPMGGPRRPDERYGAILGQIVFADCVDRHDSIWHSPGSWGWVIGRSVPLDKPIPYRGRLGFFPVTVNYNPLAGGYVIPPARGKP